MNRVRILLADDHTMFREGLEKVLNDANVFQVIDSVASGAEALVKLAHDDYDILVTDIAMDGMSGFDVLKSLKNKKSTVNVLVLSMYPPEQYAIRMLKAGALGYLTKTSSISELKTAIRQVALGKKYISQAVANLLSDLVLEDTNSAPHEMLSEREYQVMCHIANGKTLTESANLLSISINTVSTYRRRILDKMNMKNNSELVRYVILHGLMS